MKSLIIRSTKPHPKASAPQKQPNGLAAQTPSARPLSPCDDLHDLIATRAFELCRTRGYRNRFALDAWLDAEREILSLIPPQPNVTLGRPWGSVKGEGSVTEKDYFLRFRHAHGGRVVARLLARYRITSQGWRKILSATSRPLFSITSSARNCFTAVTSVVT